MASSRSLSLLLTAAVHAALLALAWTALRASQPRQGQGPERLVSVPLSRPAAMPQENSAQEQPRTAAAAPAPMPASVSTPMPAIPLAPPVAPIVLPGVPDGPVLAPAATAAVASASQASAADAGSAEGTGSGTGITARAQVAQPGSKGEDAYARRVFAWISRHKGYPGRLSREGKEGTALVRLLIDENGGLETTELVRSSGHGALDTLALEQIRDARPYPRPPRGLSSARRRFVVPMTYRLDG